LLEATTRAPGSRPLTTVAAALLCVTAPLSAQQPPDARGSDSAPGPPDVLVAGRIVDVGTDSAVAAATVTVAGTGATRWTNADGRFFLTERDFRSLPDTLVIRRLGYDSARVVVSSRPDSPVRVRLPLQRLALAVEGVTVEAERVEREARRMVDTFGGEIWTRDQFERYLPTARTALDLLRRSNHVPLIEEGHDGERCIYIVRARGCALVMVNNVRMPPEAVADLDPEIVESFVILRPNEATLPYGTGAGAGVVVLFTRTGAPR